MSEERSSKLIHEHFCSLCYGLRNGVKRGSAIGWWRCSMKPCVKPEKYLCRVHRKEEA